VVPDSFVGPLHNGKRKQKVAELGKGVQGRLIYMASLLLSYMTTIRRQGKMWATLKGGCRGEERGARVRGGSPSEALECGHRTTRWRMLKAAARGGKPLHLGLWTGKGKAKEGLIF